MFGDFYRGKRVFVTGHTGFKGSWLCEWLLKMGAQVSGLALAPNTNPSLFQVLKLEGRLQHHLADIRQAQAVFKSLQEFAPEIVIHMAAQPLVRLSYRDPLLTFETNVMGTANVLEAVRHCPSVRACVIVTTDKCYENREWPWGYREIDPMGGHDPYSASKGAAELVTASYRNSYFRESNACRIASARAGNVIGGGDWSEDRIVVDFVKSIQARQPLRLRNPQATRPWQHVLEPLSGYLTLAKFMCESEDHHFSSAWNFGPPEASVFTVEKLAKQLVAAWQQGEVVVESTEHQPHEAGLLKLDCSKAALQLGWKGRWGLEQTAQATVDWYKAFYEKETDVQKLMLRQIKAYEEQDNSIDNQNGRMAR